MLDVADDGVLIGGREKRKIALQDWDPTWSATFENERQRISSALGGVARRIEQSVPPRSPALAYLAAYDVHRAQVMGRCEDTTGIVAFGRLVEQVRACEPYASAERVFWIVDNGSSHRGKRSIERLEIQWPTLRLVHLPVHAPWLDQCEIYFSIAQRKVVKPNDFTDLDQIRDRLAGFEQRYNAVAEPFDWTFGRDDLDKLLARIDAHTAKAS